MKIKIKTFSIKLTRPLVCKVNLINTCGVILVLTTKFDQA